MSSSGSSSGRVHDRELLDALEALEAGPFSGTAWRTTWASRDPLIGSSAGGRWHPPDSFEALYTSLEADGSLAEAYFHLSRAPVFSSAQVHLCRLSVEAVRTLRLADVRTLDRLGIERGKPDTSGRMDYARSREIGAAAHFLDFDGLLVSNARWPCSNLVLFLDRFNPDQLLVETMSEVNWPGWKERRQRS